MPALISAVCVPQLGLYRARQYMLTAEKVPASQLLQEGQLSAVAADLDVAVAHYAAQLLESAPGACKLVKEACQYVAHHDDELNRAYVRTLYEKMISSPEAAYGMQCFREQKTPQWHGRSKL